MYSIGQVCSLLGIKPHILRYWEQEIPLLAPKKNLAGRRIYTQKDIQILSRLKHLIHDRKYTLQGARDKIWEEIESGNPEVHSTIAEIKDQLFRVTHLIQNRSRRKMAANSIIQQFCRLGQEHLFAGWDTRPADQKERLLSDLGELEVSYFAAVEEILRRGADSPKNIEPIDYVPCSESAGDAKLSLAGKEHLSAGKCGFVTVAGGQGSRLGFDGPKGLYPISPIRKASLFQIFAEKILAASRKYGAAMPWYIMTSPLNNDETRAFFRDHAYFGLDPNRVFFFPQRLLPSFDAEGKLMLALDGGLLKNPDGHGGLIGALKRRGLVTDMLKQGIQELFTFQIDNPLVNVPDPVFLGKHLELGSQVSSKVIAKAYPEEKLGVIGRIDGRAAVIEYSDLSPEIMNARNSSGELLFSQGSIAIHLFNVSYLAAESLELPFHAARKRVKTLIPKPQASEIQEREAIKLELFIFDTIPLADRTLFFETERQEEFAPLKNKTGVDSVKTCIDGQIQKAARRLAKCGVDVPRKKDGKSVYKLEISPLYALDEESLRKAIGNEKPVIHGDRLFA